MRLIKTFTLTSACFIAWQMALATGTNNKSFIVFSDRPKAQYQKAITAFENHTGLTLDYREEPTEQLIQKIAQGERADALIVKDLYYISTLVEKNLIQDNAFSDSLLHSVPSSLKDRRARWLPITYRVRSLVYPIQMSSEAQTIDTYADLLNPEWQGALCLRQASHPYNQSLGAHWLAELGFNQALNLLKGLVAQMAGHTYENDKAILASILRGECLLGIVNHYYVVQALRDQPHWPLAFKYLKDTTSGTPLNGVSLLLPITAKMTKATETWAHTLSRQDINSEIAEIHGDFPLSGAENINHIPRSWGTLIPSKIPWEEVLNQFRHVKSLFEGAKYQ